MTGHLQLRGFPPVSPSQPSGFPHNGIQRISVEISKQSRFFRTSCLIQCHTEKWARSSRLARQLLDNSAVEEAVSRRAWSARLRAREESQIVRTNLVLQSSPSSGRLTHVSTLISSQIGAKCSAMLRKCYANGAKWRLLSELATEVVMTQRLCFQMVASISTPLDTKWKLTEDLLR